MTARRALVLGVSVFYGLIALLVGGMSVAQCLGMNNGECIAAWYASMSPLERAIHEFPWWVAPAAIFVGLWAVTLIVLWVLRRVRSRANGPDRTMRWLLPLAALAFWAGFIAAGIYQQIQVIVQSPDCGINMCVQLQPNLTWTFVAGLAVAAETVLVARLAMLLRKTWHRRASNG